MNFTEAVAEVLTITKRPDKTADAQLAVNAAISFFTLKGSFSQDLVESTIAIDPAEYGDTISISSLTRFRRFKYVKAPGVLSYLKYLDSDKVFTPSSQMQKNCYYLAGTNMTYILSALAASLEIGYYQYPAVLSGTNTHWLLDISPYTIIDKAAARVFKQVGDDASFRLYEATAMDSFKVLQNELALSEV